MDTASPFLTPVTLGDLALPNRLVMAPLTRTRAGAAGVPGPLVAEHYAQRASLGLIVAEGTYPSHESRSYPGQPGLVTDAQQEGWRAVADAVHAAGGRIVVQLMNGGRVSHTDITGTDRIVAPSAVAVSGEAHTADGKEPYPVPHALTEEEIPGIVAEFVAAARRAVDAGLDGVEVHSANGYLLHQFLAPGSNHRTDAYGGSPQNRARLAVEVTRAVAAEIGAGRVGIRISPAHNIQDALETDPADVEATYTHLVEQLQPLGLAYLSVLHADPSGEFVQGLRKRFGGPLMVNSGFARVTAREEAAGYLADGAADVVAVGRAVMANPDLLERWVGGHPENELDPSTSYGQGAAGYTDYPFLTPRS
ncbi:alkene reductase [Kineococcus aurantiacus]|uniref:2,4-dienoyl-CoA reductase-like NADH-dependent reductase (Old Yellow Enzyme family) n=1 Tax=Kineococcus aurantiacus TaxID=37633 RepID=A0A7Y9DKY6_9ACTN|nr:2,4-dienoyl-CoA reductase-like NADH-dependent reductase (Old Yellow Enzyme family) [Kineococcus aurantiacus]